MHQYEDFMRHVFERGTLKAKAPPVVVLTSNRTRDLHEALRRRCVYHWINYPDRETEARIVMLRAPQVAKAAAHAAVNAVQALRNLALVKRPGISEAVEWATAADLLNEQGASLGDALRRSIGVALKEEDDLVLVRDDLPGLIAESVR
jgi:MoxR-like ATPase